MDNLCHTLVGAALAEAGLRKKTPLATATLLIGANIPDVDGILYWLNRPIEALGFRRGWTHGVLAVAVWPFVLAGLMLAWNRWVRRRHPDLPPADARALVWLGLLAVLTHPLLDLCNTYGVRLLMPFSAHWFHGDTLFIADPWMWLVLGLGWLVARELRRRGTARPEWPARWALGLATTYVLAMAASNLVARGIVRRAAVAEGGAPVGALMVSPQPLDPFRRAVVIERGAAYELASFDWLRLPHYRREGPLVQRLAGVDAPDARAAAAADWRGRTFLGWARFPVYDVLREPSGYEVLLADARYTLSGRARFGAVAIHVPRAISSPAGDSTQERK